MGKCSVHTTRLTQYFCSTCNIEICSICKQKEHKGHDVSTKTQKSKEEVCKIHNRLKLKLTEEKSECLGCLYSEELNNGKEGSFEFVDQLKDAKDPKWKWLKRLQEKEWDQSSMASFLNKLNEDEEGKEVVYQLKLLVLYNLLQNPKEIGDIKIQLPQKVIDEARDIFVSEYKAEVDKVLNKTKETVKILCEQINNDENMDQFLNVLFDENDIYARKAAAFMKDDLEEILDGEDHEKGIKIQQIAKKVMMEKLMKKESVVICESKDLMKTIANLLV